MSEDTVTMNVKGLDQILKALKVKLPVARVGILGGGVRSGKGQGQTNAEVGAAHEYGTSKLPQRSFLRVPLFERLNKELEASGALDKDTLQEVIKSGSVLPWLKKVTIVAEKIVLGAFDSQGYGKWPSWKNPSYTNNTGQVLVDSTQLRNSITSEVKG